MFGRNSSCIRMRCELVAGITNGAVFLAGDVSIFLVGLIFCETFERALRWVRGGSHRDAWQSHTQAGVHIICMREWVGVNAC